MKHAVGWNDDQPSKLCTALAHTATHLRGPIHPYIPPSNRTHGSSIDTTLSVPVCVCVCVCVGLCVCVCGRVRVRLCVYLILAVMQFILLYSSSVWPRP